MKQILQQSIVRSRVWISLIASWALCEHAEIQNFTETQFVSQLRKNRSRKQIEKGYNQDPVQMSCLNRNFSEALSICYAIQHIKLDIEITNYISYKFPKS